MSEHKAYAEFVAFVERHPLSATMSMDDLHKAVTAHVVANNTGGVMDPKAALGHALSMMKGWYDFVDNDPDGTFLDWMDPAVVQLLNAAMTLHFLNGEPWPKRADPE